MKADAGASRDWTRDGNSRAGNDVLYWAITFFIIALAAALLGFTGISAGIAAIGKTFFFVFLVLFVVSLVASLLKR
jgi:uncharacterized membrane protein YtjA (UPF0391 family)